MNRKKSQTFQRKSQNLIRYDKVNKLKQLGFTTSWNINEQKKDYNALEDPHADRYFRYQSVKIHMKQLKRSLNKSQKNDTQKKFLAKLIKEKLSDHLPAIKVAAQTYNIPTAQLNKSQVTQVLSKQKSLKGLNKQKSLTEFVKNHRKNKSKKKKHHDTQKHSNADFSVEQNFNMSHQKQRPSQNKQSSFSEKAHTQNNLIQGSQKSIKMQDRKQSQRQQYLKKQQELLHKKKHQEFISFIAKKRQNLESLNK